MLNGSSLSKFQSIVFKTTAPALPTQTLPLMGLSATTVVMLQTYKERILHALEHMMLPAMALLTPAPTHVVDFIQQELKPTIERIATPGTHAPFSHLVQHTGNTPFNGALDNLFTQSPLKPDPQGGGSGDGSNGNQLTQKNTLDRDVVSNVEAIKMLNQWQVSTQNQSPSPEPEPTQDSQFFSRHEELIKSREPLTQNIRVLENVHQIAGEKLSMAASPKTLLERAETFYQFLYGLGSDLKAPDTCPDCTFLVKGDHLPTKGHIQKYEYEDLLGRYELLEGLSARQLHEATIKAIDSGMIKPSDPFIQTTSSPYDIPSFTPEEEKLLAGVWDEIFTKERQKLGEYWAQMQLDNKGIYLRKTAPNSGQSLRERIFFAVLKAIPWHKTSFDTLEGNIENGMILSNRMLYNSKGILEKTNPCDVYLFNKVINRNAFEAFSHYATSKRYTNKEEDFFR